jgi:hypothetical protein
MHGGERAAFLVAFCGSWFINETFGLFELVEPLVTIFGLTSSCTRSSPLPSSSMSASLRQQPVSRVETKLI